jgi:hypothetical protein
MCDNPFYNQAVPFMHYRITAPCIAWILGLKGKWVFLVQYLPIPMTLSVIYFALAKRTRRDLATVVTACLSLTFTFVWANTRGGYADAVTHLMVALMLLTTSNLLTILLVVLSTLNDERTLFAIPFLVLWHGEHKSLLQVLRDRWSYIGSIICGGGIVLLIRHAMTVGWIGPGIPPPPTYNELGQGLQSGLMPLSFYFGNIILGYRYVWAIPMLFLSVPLGPNSRMIKIIYALSLILFIYATFAVSDISRTICFTYTAILVAISYLYQENAERVYHFTMGCLSLCIITPSFYLMPPDSIHLYRPLLIGLLQRFFYTDPLSPAIRSMYPILEHIEPH